MLFNSFMKSIHKIVFDKKYEFMLNFTVKEILNQS